MNCSKLCFYQCLLTLAFNSTAWRLIFSEVVPFVSSLYSILFMYLFSFVKKKHGSMSCFSSPHRIDFADITVNSLSLQGVLWVFLCDLQPIVDLVHQPPESVTWHTPKRTQWPQGQWGGQVPLAVRGQVGRAVPTGFICSQVRFSLDEIGISNFLRFQNTKFKLYGENIFIKFKFVAHSKAYKPIQMAL